MDQKAQHEQKPRPDIAVGAVLLVITAIVLGWLYSESDWGRIDIYADVYASKQLCEMDWGDGCRFDAKENAFLGPFYEGQICRKGWCSGYYRPRTTSNNERTAVYGGAGGYVKRLRGGAIARREPKDEESLGDVPILNPNSNVEGKQPSR